MEFMGTLKIRKDKAGYILKYNSLYFCFNNSEYLQLKKLYFLITSNGKLSTKQKKTPVYSFLYSTGNVPRLGISVLSDYADVIRLSSCEIKKTNKFNKELKFFLDAFFNTKRIAVCDMEYKLLFNSDKDSIYFDLLSAKDGVPDRLLLIRMDSVVYNKVIVPQSFFGQVVSKPCNCIRGPVVFFKKAPPEANNDGCILVKEFTEPSDLPTMNCAKAIITEIGGILSHAAIVSRELNIPCIVGVKKITKLVKEGDEVELNLETGEIKLLEHKN